MREGELFQETARASGDPAVSPDGTQIAVVLRDRDQPEKLVVWSTGAAEEEEKKYEERVEKILARDPEDVRAVRTKPLPRKAVHSLVMPDGGDIDGPRWMRDGKSLLFAHRVRDAEGFLHFDLYRWDFTSLTRITHLADVRDADPLPDSRTAVAVRSRFGATQLVTVDLASGEVTPRTEASIDTVVTHPRVSPDGQRIAHVAHRGGRWTLYVEDVAVAVPGDPASPEWISNDELVVTVFSRGFAELFGVRWPQPPLWEGGGLARSPTKAVAAATALQNAVTRTSGGAFDAAPSPDGRLFFMSLDPDGYVVRVLDKIEPALPPPVLDASLVPAIPPQPPTPPLFTAQPVTSRPYGIGRQELGWFTSTNLAPDQQAIELGVRLGDVVGRLDTLLMGSLGRQDAVEGLALATAWRGWPVELHAHAFATDATDGVEVRGRWSRHFQQSRLTFEAGALSDDLLFGSGAFSTRQVMGTASLEEAFRFDVDDDHYRGVASVTYRAGSLRIAGRYQRDSGANVTLGGLASSILPRSAYAHRILDPALPVAILAGDDYDGWRIESTVPRLPFTAFYQRHTLDGTDLSLAGAQVGAAHRSEPDPQAAGPRLHARRGACISTRHCKAKRNGGWACGGVHDSHPQRRRRRGAGAAQRHPRRARRLFASRSSRARSSPGRSGSKRARSASPRRIGDDLLRVRTGCSSRSRRSTRRGGGRDRALVRARSLLPRASHLSAGSASRRAACRWSGARAARRAGRADLTCSSSRARAVTPPMTSIAARGLARLHLVRSDGAESVARRARRPTSRFFAKGSRCTPRVFPRRATGSARSSSAPSTTIAGGLTDFATLFDRFNAEAAALRLRRLARSSATCARWPGAAVPLITITEREPPPKALFTITPAGENVLARRGRRPHRQRSRSTGSAART